jgi:hypothetical protein
MELRTRGAADRAQPARTRGAGRFGVREKGAPKGSRPGFRRSA